MNEDVLVRTLLSDEPVTLRVVKPLHLPAWQAIHHLSPKEANALHKPDRTHVISQESAGITASPIMRRNSLESW